VSWPLRGTSRDTQTAVGRSPSRCRARTSAPEASGRNAVVSTPGGSRTNRGPGPYAPASRTRMYSVRYVTTSTPAPIRRSSCRLPGSAAQPTSCPWLAATIRSTPAFRSAGASRPSGADAPNHAAVQPSALATARTRRATSGVGSSMPVGWRTTGNGWAASNSAAPGEVEANTTTDPGGWRTASSCTYAWMPPARGGKSLVTTSVRLTGTRPARCAATAR
jgi:hypothetical protein